MSRDYPNFIKYIFIYNKAAQKSGFIILNIYENNFYLANHPPSTTSTCPLT